MFQMIQEDILHFADEYLGQGFLFAFLCMAFMAVGICVGRKMKGVPRLEFKKKIVYKVFLFYFFLVYIYIVLGITFFSREPSKTATLDLKLFHTFANNLTAKLFIYENILMFVPLGIFVYLLFNKFRKLYANILLAFSCSLLIEITQYVTRLGKFQVDDILNNVLGMLIGYGIGWCMVKAYKRKAGHSQKTSSF